MNASKQHIVFFVVSTVAVLLVFAAQILLGTVTITIADFISMVKGSGNPVYKNIVVDSRLPGAVASLVAGAALSVAGLQMQTMFRNPVAGPYVLGISAGASLGVALLLMGASAFPLLLQMQFLGNSVVVVAALLGSMLVFALVMLITTRVQDMVAVLIIGLMIGGSISALIDILQVQASEVALKNFVLWTFGSFRYISLQNALTLTITATVGMLMAFFIAKPLNVLLLGDYYAQTSGVNVRHVKRWIVVSSSLLAGVVTAFCGPIGFVGLAVPHMARGILNTSNHQVLIPACVVLGAVVCGVCNILASMPWSDSVVPVNSVTALIGGPFVVWIIIKQKHY